jgi:DNA primase
VIVTVIQRYYPDWEPPEDKHEWNKCLCPFHGETRKSAVVSFTHDAFKCFACPVKGSAEQLIRQEEGVSLAEANRIAAGLSPGRDPAIQEQPARKSCRRVFGEQGIDEPEDQAGGRSVSAGIRGRSTPWT